MVAASSFADVDAGFSIIIKLVTILFTMLALFALALIEVAIDTKKHAKLTLVKNVTQLCAGIEIWWMLGVGFAFGDVDEGFIGDENFGGDDYQIESFADTWFLTCALDGLFGICAVYAINGIISERCNHTTYILLSVLVMGWVYPCVVAWGWGNGWLNYQVDDMLFRDDSGAGTVHLLAASMGLVGTLFLGPRHGRFKSHTLSYKVNGEERQRILEPDEVTGHYSLVYATLGLLMVWAALLAIGGYGGVDPMHAARGYCNTLVAGCSGGLAALLIRTCTDRDFGMHFGGILYGVAAGCISMAACPLRVDVYEAFFIGLIGGALYALFEIGIGKCACIDDPLDGLGYHGVCGAWGLLAAGFFDENEGVFHDGDGSLIGLQFLGMVVIFAWGVFWAVLFFGIMKLTGALRMPEDVECLGLDYADMGWNGYKLKGDISSSGHARQTSTEVQEMKGIAEPDKNED